MQLSGYRCPVTNLWGLFSRTRFCLLADYRAYIAAQDKVAALFKVGGRYWVSLLPLCFKAGDGLDECWCIYVQWNPHSRICRVLLFCICFAFASVAAVTTSLPCAGMYCLCCQHDSSLCCVSVLSSQLIFVLWCIVCAISTAVPCAVMYCLWLCHQHSCSLCCDVLFVSVSLMHFLLSLPCAVMYCLWPCCQHSCPLCCDVLFVPSAQLCLALWCIVCGCSLCCDVLFVAVPCAVMYCLWLFLALWCIVSKSPMHLLLSLLCAVMYYLYLCLWHSSCCPFLMCICLFCTSLHHAVTSFHDLAIML